MKRVAVLGLAALALAGCGGAHAAKATSTAKTTSTAAVRHYPAAEKSACKKLDGAAVPGNNYSPVTLEGLRPYAQAVQALVQTAYGPGSGVVLKAQRDVLNLPAVGRLSDQQFAQVQRDDTALGTMCGQVLAGP